MTLINTGNSNRDIGGFYFHFDQKDYTLRFVHSNGSEEAGNRRNRPEHSHALYHIIVIYSGEGTFLLNRKQVAVSPGSIMFISPGQPHSLGVKDGESVTYGEITFEFLDGEGIPLHLNISRVLSLIVGIDISIHSLEKTISSNAVSHVNRCLLDLEKLRSFQGKDSYFHISTSSILISCLRALSGHFADVNSENTIISPMEKILAFIRANYQQPLTLTDLSHIGAFTTKYLSRRFKELYGQTPIYFRDSLRIESACELLRGTHYSVGEIAVKCGFTDIYYFSKIFKKRTGKSPGEYRRNS